MKCLNRNKTEIILSAALWLDNGLKYRQQPINIETGIVVPGYRHGTTYQTIDILMGDNNGFGKHKITEGFMTNRFRFVDRNEAFVIAKAAKQIINDINENEYYSDTLHSVDLY